MYFKATLTWLLGCQVVVLDKCCKSCDALKDRVNRADSYCLMLPGLGSVPGFRDGERRPRGVGESAALGGASLSDSVGADLLCGE